MTSAAPLVSVVMGVRNGIDSLEATLTSLTQGQNLDFEVIVINDGSKDATLQVLKDAFGLLPFPEAECSYLKSFFPHQMIQ